MYNIICIRNLDYNRCIKTFIQKLGNRCTPATERPKRVQTEYRKKQSVCIVLTYLGFKTQRVCFHTKISHYQSASGYSVECRAPVIPHAIYWYHIKELDIMDGSKASLAGSEWVGKHRSQHSSQPFAHTDIIKTNKPASLKWILEYY